MTKVVHVCITKTLFSSEVKISWYIYVIMMLSLEIPSSSWKYQHVSEILQISLLASCPMNQCPDLTVSHNLQQLVSFYW